MTIDAAAERDSVALRVLPVNVDAVLIEVPGLREAMALHDALHAAAIPGVTELVPAMRTVLVRYKPAYVARAPLLAQIARVAAQLAPPARQSPDQRSSDSRPVEIPVHYDGEDLNDVARLLGLTPAEVVQRHTGSTYTVAFCGFAPGFAYLAGGDPVLDVPRRASPRTRVPAGAVALAGTFSGVYPKDSPGGWQLIGRTTLAMWDLSRESPALLRPGVRVRFVEASPSVTTVRCDPASKPQDTRVKPLSVAQLVVRRPGLQTLFQDLGRPGQAGQGVSVSGALDRAALREANQLVGNDDGEAALEIMVLGGFELECRGMAVVAVTGAEARLWVHGADARRFAVERHAPLALDEGDRLFIETPTAGARAYLAVRGGFQADLVMGSVSTDLLAGLGPEAVRAGDVIDVKAPRNCACVGLPAGDRPALPRAGDVITLDVVMGPRTDWFDDASIRRFAEQEWQVTPTSNRVGLRLQGELALERRTDGGLPKELPSEGTCPGALQVPASGQPVLFLADHPVTGGYPVIANVAAHHLDLAGQVPAGARLRFRPVAAFEPVELA